MTDAHKAALVVEDGQLVGIVSFKDVMSRALAKELPLELTAVTSIMTPNPESVTPDTTVLEAMQIMHENKFLTLPVCEDSGDVVGVVDVMDVIYGCGGAEGWRSIFDSAMDGVDDATDNESTYSQGQSISVPMLTAAPVIKVPVVSFPPKIFVEPPVNTNIPVNININADGNSQDLSFGGSHVGSMHDMGRGDGVSLLDNETMSYSLSVDHNFVFKVVDSRTGNTYRIRCEHKFAKLLTAVSEKLGNEVEVSTIHLSFVDDDGDSVLLKDNDCLIEAVHTAKSAGKQALKISVSVVASKRDCGPGQGAAEKDMTTMAAVGAGVLVVAFLFVMATKKR